MSQRFAQGRVKVLMLSGFILILGSGGFYVFEQAMRDYSELLRTAEVQHQARHHVAAVTTYQHVLKRVQAWDIRLFNVIFGHRINTAHIRLALANTQYSRAEAALRLYQSDPRTSDDASGLTLTAVQGLLSTAVQAFDAVPKIDPHVYVSAQINAGRAEAWQLILAATQEQTRGQRTLNQLATQTIERIAHAVDMAHQQRLDWPRQAWMTAILLLESMTQFSQEPSRPRMVEDRTELTIALGDLLLQDKPELSAEARQRFQNFFFAIPFEADNPWPDQNLDEAGATTPQALH